MKHTLLLFTFMCALVCNTHAQLRSGPMVGAVEMREAKIWVQTLLPSDVFVTYAEATGKTFTTTTAHTAAENACTAVLIADSVEPGRKYTYNVHISGKKVSLSYPTTFTTPPIWKWRSDSLPSISVAFGSCFYVNEPGYERWDKNGNESGYGSEYEIVTSIANKHPDAMIWLGDNVYLREPDWNSRSGILKRYTHTRSLPQLQPLLASTSNYATWDDHDYGPNDADRSFSGKGHALDAFKLFWANPSYGVMDMPGITTSFELIDAQFFLLDDRYYRSPNKEEDTTAQILGAMQTQWLIDALSASTATFKIICIGSQFLTDSKQKESFARAPSERTQIIDALTQRKIEGVIFLTGDIHAAELSKMERQGTYPLYEFTSSSLTAGSNKSIATQSNTYRVPTTEYGEHNFGMIQVRGKKSARVLTMTLYNKDGAEVWSREINETELR